MDGGFKKKKNKNAVAQTSSSSGLPLTNQSARTYPVTTSSSSDKSVSNRDLIDSVDGYTAQADRHQQPDCRDAYRNGANRSDKTWNNHAGERSDSPLVSQSVLGIDDQNLPGAGETASMNTLLDNDVHQDVLCKDDNFGSSCREWQDDDTFDHPEWQFLKEYTDPTLDTVTDVGASRVPHVGTTSMMQVESQLPVTGATPDDTNQLGNASSPDSTTADKSNQQKVTNRYRETNATLARLVEPEGLILKDVFADGNCLFAAVVDQLRVRGEFFYTTRSLREAAVKYLREHPCQEDGTPLHLFLTEHDGTWDQYLTRMSREGEWGDHFVISALASVLKRRLIIMRGFDKLRRTVMEPSTPGKPETPASVEPGADKYNKPHQPGSQTSAKPGAEHDDSRVQDDRGQREEVSGEGPVEDQHQPGDLYIGHIAEAHYVSLRYIDWEDRFYRSLNERPVPLFLKYSPDLEPYQQQASSERVSEGENLSTPAFPVVHLDFFLKYIASGDFILNFPLTGLFPVKHDDQMSQIVVLGDLACGLDSLILLGRMQNKSRAKFRAWADNNVAANGSLWDLQQLDWYIVPNDTKVRQPDSIRNVVPKKDLVAIEMDCPVGYTRLLPIVPALWVKAIVQQGDIDFLRQLHLPFPNVPHRSIRTYIAFPSSWPHCSDFLTRQRSYGWPDESLLDSAKNKGVHVIPEASYDSENHLIEWRFSFKNTEKLLCLWMSPHMKNCYFYLRGVCQVLFQDKQFRFEHQDSVCKDQLKAVFFYTCEQLPVVWFQEHPGRCLLIMLKKLQDHLETGFLPDYFIPQANLIDGVEEHVLLWHAEQLAWYQKHILESTFLIFDKEDVMNIFGLGQCFEMLVSDAQRYVAHGSLELSYNDCFLPLNIFCIQNWVKLQRFDRAEELCDKAIEECPTYMQTVDAAQMILPRVLAGLPLLEKWLFAFYMDLMIGSHLLHLACVGHECAQLDTVFGDACVTTLADDLLSVPPVDLKVPLTIVYSESIVLFAERFTLILYDQDELGAFKAATHFFLKNKARELILNIAAEEEAGIYHTGHNDTKIRLRSMFGLLYHVYNKDKQWSVFFDLMEEYDLLSQHFHHVQLNEHVAILWKYFGKPNNYAAAAARFRSLLNPH